MDTNHDAIQSGLFDSSSGYLLVVGALISSLVAIYTLVLFVKAKFLPTTTTNDKSSSNAQLLLCTNCQQSKFNCKLVYNRFFAPDSQTATATSGSNGRSNGKRPNAEQRCARCGVKLAKLAPGLHQNQGTNYGKVDQSASCVKVEPVEGEQNGGYRGIESEIKATSGCEKTTLCTGLTFDPDAISTVAPESLASKSPEEFTSLASDSLSFQTIVEFPPISDEQLATVAEEGEEVEGTITTTTATSNSPEQSLGSANQSASQKLARFTKLSRGLLKAKQLVSIMQKIRDNSTISPFSSSSLANQNKSNNSSDFIEEPEFLNSRKLRSAEIQIAGLSQHPIIFGKSKDSILVPEFTCEQQKQQQQHQLNIQHQLQYQEQYNATSCNTNNNNYLQQQQFEVDPFSGNELELGAGSSSSESQFHRATTHVLTDEKGHSIKIRIASPPPQRQSQLAKLHQQQQLQLQHRRQSLANSTTNQPPEEQQQASTRFGQRDSIVSLSSDSPLISNAGRFNRRSSSSATETTTGSPLNAEAWPSQRPAVLSEWAEFSNDEQQQQQQQTSDLLVSPSSGRRLKSRRFSQVAQLTRSQTHQTTTPIEPFNDSKTSEFDDNDVWDSRQDTSLDHQINGTCQLVNANRKHNNLNDDQVQAGADSSVNVASSNDSVMDADLRRTNRLNLELLMLQRGAQNMMGAMGHQQQQQQQVQPLITSQGDLLNHDDWKTSRSKSIGGSQASAFLAGASSSAGFSVSSVAFPQSGVLVAASEALNPTRQNAPSAEQLVALHRQLSGTASNNNVNVNVNGRQSRINSTSDQDSGYNCASDSRKSSLINPFNSVPSIRIQVRRLSGPISGDRLAGKSTTNDSAPGKRQQIERQSTNDSMGGGRRSLLNTLASIGRSASRQSSGEPADQQQQQQQQQADQSFEISIVEARNLVKKSNATQTDLQQARAGRRESLFGAFMAAATQSTGGAQLAGNNQLAGNHLAQSNSPGASRRASIDGISIRIFKHQAGKGEHSENNTIATTGKGLSSGLSQENADTVSLNSHASLNSTASSQQVDFIQLPTIKLSSNEFDGTTLRDIVKLSEVTPTPNAYKFTCKPHEFPLRISVYQVSKRGGARYTIGHCFITADDWELSSSSSSEPMKRDLRSSRTSSADSGTDQQQISTNNQDAASISGSSGNNRRWPSESSGEPIVSMGRYRLIARRSSGSSQTLDETNDNNNSACEQLFEEDEFLLEYKLHQTILEATKC